MPQMTNETLEYFINEVLKEDLKELENCINKYNEEIMEYIQLKNSLEALEDNMDDGFKTQMNIGGNVFMEAKVDNLDKIIVDIGKSVYLEFTLKEAIKFADFKTKVLTNQCNVLRDESVKKRAQIKLALLCMGESEQLYQNVDK